MKYNWIEKESRIWKWIIIIIKWLLFGLFIYVIAEHAMITVIDNRLDRFDKYYKAKYQVVK